MKLTEKALRLITTIIPKGVLAITVKTEVTDIDWSLNLGRFNSFGLVFEFTFKPKEAFYGDTHIIDLVTGECKPLVSTNLPDHLSALQPVKGVKLSAPSLDVLIYALSHQSDVLTDSVLHLRNITLSTSWHGSGLMYGIPVDFIFSEGDHPSTGYYRVDLHTGYLIPESKVSAKEGGFKVIDFNDTKTNTPKDLRGDDTVPYIHVK